MNGFILIFYTCVLFSVSHGDYFGLLGNLFEEHNKIVAASRNLDEYLDHDVNPCDNFYKFSCGKWIKTQQEIYGKAKDINIGNRHINFNNFVKEFEKGKNFNGSSVLYNVITDIHKLWIQCNELLEAEIGHCQSEILYFGKSALRLAFIENYHYKNITLEKYNIIEDMIVRIKEELRLLIDEKKDIFDEETRNNFLFKLNTMKFVKPSYNLSYVELVESCYANQIILIKFKPIQYVLGFIRKLKEYPFGHNDILALCGREFLQVEKFMNLDVYANALYYYDLNTFSINFDTLNEPSFSLYYPMSLNYGYLGFTIAHEMMHAFDNENYNRTLYGYNENKFNVTQMSVKNFEEKSRCFVKQYGLQKESITKKNINGLLTLHENIADNGGLKIAHRAYMKWLQSNSGKDIKFPSFEEFTKEQLFFISYGRKYCEYNSEEFLEIQKNPHLRTPAEIRTNVVLSNYKPFSDAFKCPVNSKMNPENKCEL